MAIGFGVLCVVLSRCINCSLPVYLAGVVADPKPAAEASVHGRRVQGAVRGSLPVY